MALRLIYIAADSVGSVSRGFPCASDQIRDGSLRQAMDETKTTAVLWLNSAETFIDISEADAIQGKSSHWASESGVIDVFIMSSADPKEVSVQYTDLTGG